MWTRTSRRVVSLSLLVGTIALCSIAPAQEPKIPKPVGMEWLSEDTGLQTTDEGNRQSAGKKALMYPVNRLADFLDIASMNIGFGLGLRFNAHATRAAQLGAGAGVMSKVGLDGRRLGLFNESRSELSALCFTMEHYERVRAFGFVGPASTSREPDRLYLDARRFTGVGMGVDAAIVGMEAELKPSEVVDFLAGFAGIDFKRDDYPRGILRPDYSRFYSEHRRGIDRIVFVTSRVVDSPHLRGETEEGVAVLDQRMRSARFLGEIGMWTGRDQDAKAEKDFARYMEEAGNYDAAMAVALSLAKAMRDRTSIEIVPPTALAEFEKQKVRKELAGETILRLPNYKGLCDAYGADAVCDVRLLEWSLLHDAATGDLKVRLDVECKVIRQPQNSLLADISVLSYDRGKRGGSLKDFARDEGHLLRFETEQAVERVVSVLGDRLLEP
ncbi:hypothetical protein JW916_07775 [Candidatus Sumerlaeota bacterium]|nr:hypothetical protein [Candidatus Sumerlaeota bacterium]